MQFLVIAHDGTDAEAIDRRMAAREAHIALGNQMRDRGEFLYGVALLDPAQKMIGSVMVMEFPAREQLDAWLKAEPYVTGKAWEKIEVLPCRVGPSFTKNGPAG